MVEALFTQQWQIRTMSKWVLSNVFHFFSMPEALKARQASRKMNEACLVSFNIGKLDLQATIDSLNVAINMRFSTED